MPPQATDEWEKYATPTTTGDEWEKYTTPSASAPTPAAPTFSNVYTRHPIASEAALGLSEGMGIPQGASVGEMAKSGWEGVKSLFKPTPEEMAEIKQNPEGYALPLSIPLHHVAMGLLNMNKEYKRQVVEGLKTGDYPELAHGGAAMAGEVLTAFLGRTAKGGPSVMTPSEELATHGVVRLGQSMDATQKLIKSGINSMHMGTEIAADTIRKADIAKSPTGSMDVAPAHTALLKAKEAISGQPKLFPVVDQAEAILDRATNGPAPYNIDTAQGAKPLRSWEDVKQVRSRISNLMYKASPTEQKILMPAKNALTDMLRSRAEELGQKAAFDLYNDIHSRLMNYKENLLDDLTQNHNDPTTYFKKMYTATQKQVMLPKLIEILGDEDFNKFSGAGDAIRQELSNNKVFRDILERPDNRTFMGRIGSIARHPVYGGLGVLLGGLAGRASGMPGGTWIGGMLGGGAGATLGDKLALIEALRATNRGPMPFHSGPFDLSEGETPRGHDDPQLWQTLESLRKPTGGVPEPSPDAQRAAVQSQRAQAIQRGKQGAGPAAWRKFRGEE